MWLVYERHSTLNALVEDGGAAGLAVSEVARLTGVAEETALARLRGLRMAHEAECRNGRWYATARGQAVVTPPDAWADNVPF